jgi:hypothetical protein
VFTVATVRLACGAEAGLGPRHHGGEGGTVLGRRYRVGGPTTGSFLLGRKRCRERRADAEASSDEFGMFSGSSVVSSTVYSRPAETMTPTCGR